MRHLSRGQEIALCAGLAGLSVAGIAYHAAPEASQELIQNISEIDIIPNAETQASTNGSPTTVEAASCTNISDVDLDARIGALLIPMAEVTQLDDLLGALSQFHISNFTLTTLQSEIGDSAVLAGQTLPTSGPNSVFNNLKSAVLAQTQVVTTMFLDEEGGRVQRTQTITGFEHLPSAAEQSLLPLDQVSAQWQTHAANLETMGVDVVFGPVSDIGAADSDIASLGRSYGANVVAYAGAVVDALQANEIEATLKHFLYGTVVSNTHNSPGFTKPFSELGAETAALQQLITTVSPGNIMVSHATIPGLSGPVDSRSKGENHPASLSPAVYDYIRQTLGFGGVTITDALDMEALRVSLNPTSPPDVLTAQTQGAWQAIAAGADMAIVSLDAAGPAYTEIKQAVADGRLSEDRLNSAAAAVFEINKGYDICGR